MKNKEGTFMNKLKNNDKGMALITVLVVIGFIGALVSIVLTTTLVNYKMKSVNTRGKDTFYSAEQVLDEITIGLQRVVSDALSESYVEILENYGNYDNDTKKATIQTRYYEKLWGALEVDGSGHAYYDIDKLEKFLKTSTKWQPTYDDDGNVNGGYGAIITALDTNLDDDGEVVKQERKYGTMLSFADNGIVLKDIKVYYKDVYGFVSVVQTDIRLVYPNFEFAKSTMLPEIPEYCFIADGGVEKTETGNLTIDGNMYANDAQFKNNDITVTPENLVIVKHDLNVKSGSFIAESDLELWTKDFVAKSSTVDINGKVFVADDIDIQGRNTNLKLSGEYTGFGYSFSDPDKSSAILVNGKDSIIDLSNLKAFTLGGHAFLGSYKDKVNESDPGIDRVYQSFVKLNNGTIDTDSKKIVNVYTGESIAIKPDQLMYLVPDEAIGIDQSNERKIIPTRENNDSYIYEWTNPMTKKSWLKLVAEVKASVGSDEKNYAVVSDSIKISKLGNDTLADYIRYNGKDVDFYYHEIPVEDESIGSLVYLYMLFDNEDQANDYASKYYLMNEAITGKYAKSYLKSIKLPTKNKMITFGNVYLSDDEGELVGGLVPESGLSYTQAREDALKKGQAFPEHNIESEGNKALVEKLNSDNNQFTAYTKRLVSNLSEAIGKSDNTDGKDKTNVDSQVVFENVASERNQINEFIDAYVNDFKEPGEDDETPNVAIVHSVSTVGADPKQTLTFTSDAGEKAIVSTDDLTINDNSVRLVVCAGDVLVESGTFKGVILADGKITFGSASTTCKKDPDAVRRCLNFGFDTNSGLHYSIASCLADGNDYIFATYDNKNEKNDTSLTGLVIYENWKKE